MATYRYKGSIVINRSVEVVFTYVTDIQKMPDWASNALTATVISGGPIGRGTRYTLVVKAAGGGGAVGEVEITEYEPNRLISSKTTFNGIGEMHYLTCRFESIGGRTKLTFMSEVEYHGFFDNIAGFFLDDRRQKEFESDCNKLKELLESDDFADRDVIEGINSRSKISNHGLRLATKNNIFVSYRREDSTDIVGRIYDRLTHHFSQDVVFKDVDSIPLGVDFRHHLDQMVGECKILLAVIGTQWSIGELDESRDFVRIEIESALKRGIPVIPVLVAGRTMPPEEDLPLAMKDLAYRTGIPIRPDPDFHNDMDRLIASLAVHVKR